jgi:hypothetical protein
MIAIFFAGAFCSVGYALNKQGSEDVNGQIKVFNVVLFAPAGNGVINGIAPRKEACIKGYEFYYDDLDLVVSFTPNDSVWRITTRNKNTTMFGIVPGDSFLQAKKKILQLGFTQSYTPYKFAKDWCLFTLLVDEKNNVFGMTVEVLD